MAITKIQSESLNLADTYDFTGTVTGAGGTNTPAFHAHASGTQTISNGVATKLQYGTETFDTDNCYDTTNYRFIPNVAGKYYFKAQARTTTTVDFTTIWMQIYKNGSTIVSRVLQPQDDYSAVAASVIVDMNGTTDYLEAFFTHNRGTTTDLESQIYSCYSEGFRIIT